MKLINSFGLTALILIQFYVCAFVAGQEKSTAKVPEGYEEKILRDKFGRTTTILVPVRDETPEQRMDRIRDRAKRATEAKMTSIDGVDMSMRDPMFLKSMNLVLSLPSGATALELDEEKAEEIKQLIAECETARSEVRPDLKERVSRSYAEMLTEMLSNEQLTRLHETNWYKHGFAKLLTETVVGDGLNLTADERKRIRKNADIIARDMRETISRSKEECLSIYRQTLSKEQLDLLHELFGKTVEKEIQRLKIEHLVILFDYSRVTWAGYSGIPKMRLDDEELNETELALKKKLHERWEHEGMVELLHKSTRWLPPIRTLASLKSGQKLLNLTQEQCDALQQVFEELDAAVKESVANKDHRVITESIREKYAPRIHGLLTREQIDVIRYAECTSGPKRITETFVATIIDISPKTQAEIRRQSNLQASNMRAAIESLNDRCVQLIKQAVSDAEFKLLDEATDMAGETRKTPIDVLAIRHDYSSVEGVEERANDPDTVQEGNQARQATIVEAEPLSGQEKNTEPIPEGYEEKILRDGFGGTTRILVKKKELSAEERMERTRMEAKRAADEKMTTINGVVVSLRNPMFLESMNLVLSFPTGAAALDLDEAKAEKIRQLLAECETARSEVDGEQSTRVARSYAELLTGMLSNNQLERLIETDWFNHGFPKLLTETVVGEAVRLSADERKRIREIANTIVGDIHETISKSKEECLGVYRETLTQQQLSLLDELFSESVEKRIQRVRIESLIHEFDYSKAKWIGYTGTPKIQLDREELNVREFALKNELLELWQYEEMVEFLNEQTFWLPTIRTLATHEFGQKTLNLTHKQCDAIEKAFAELDTAVRESDARGEHRIKTNEIRKEYAPRIYNLLTKDQLDVIRYVECSRGPKRVTDTLIGELLDLSPETQAEIRRLSDIQARKMREATDSLRDRCIRLVKQYLSETEFKALNDATNFEERTRETPMHALAKHHDYSSTGNKGR